MKLQVSKDLLLVVPLLVLLVSNAAAYWTLDGNAICTAGSNQGYPVIVSDGSGGAIIAWVDYRSGGYSDIYAQRVNASGAPQWTSNGVAICLAARSQEVPTIVSDGSGGAIIAWRDYRNGSLADIYAQRVNAAGTSQWTADGVAICTAAGDQLFSNVISDGSGGAIITWHDYRGGSYSDIYAQRVNASGASQWTADGVAICTAANSQSMPTIVSDGSGGAIITWHDYRSANYDIYAQRVNASGTPQWLADGVSICTAASHQEYPVIVSDGSGGAIITWIDRRGGIYWHIYAQRVNGSGTPQWATDGVALCTAAGDRARPTITSDSAGGAIVTWYELRYGGNKDVFAQRVNASGTPQWTADGVAICTAAGDQEYPSIVSNGSGGAIITWEDYRSGSYSDIYAQAVDALGTPRWTANGVAVCAAVDEQIGPTIAPDALGGAFITWSDNRSVSNSDIYAQVIGSDGQPGYLASGLGSVLDVPHDEGGWVRITIDRSGLDDEAETERPVAIYNVWQRVDNPALLEGTADAGTMAGPVSAIQESNPALAEAIDACKGAGLPIREVGGRYFVHSRELLGAGSLPPGAWELLGSFAACQQDHYIYRASTLADSTGAGIPYAVYFVSAHTTTPSIWYASDPDSGYSVDNIAPVQPVQFSAQQSFDPIGLILSWGSRSVMALGDGDFSHYALYRSTDPDFTPGAGNRIYEGPEMTYFDGDWRWGSSFCYKLSAVDIHGNESTYGVVMPDNVTGVENPTAPAATHLSQNAPNPFNPMTAIRFGLKEACRVSLTIYDVSGRLVRVLVKGERSAAQYIEVWDGRDASGREVASGVYFYRLDAGSFTQTRKMILIR